METVGKVLGWAVVSAGQEKPLTHEMFSCQKGEVVIATSPRGKTERSWFGSSEQPLSSENPRALLGIA